MADLSPKALSILSTAFILRGMFGVFMCLLFLVWPKASLIIVQVALWIYLLADGGLEISIGFKLKSAGLAFWFVTVLVGILQFLGGFYFLAHLDRMGYVAVALLSAILLSRAIEWVFMIVNPQIASRFKGWLILLTVWALLFSVLLLGLSPDRPQDVAKTLAIYQLLAGPMLMVIGWQFRGQFLAPTRSPS